MAVTFEGGAPVGFITLDKPPANSYDFAFMEEMGAAVDAAAADDAVKAVIVRSGSKKFFCAGADIKAFLANDTAGNMKMIERGHAALAAIAEVPKVFIAQIEGHALGGGLEIALACDLRFGARGTYKLGVPEVTLGLLPGNGGTQRLPRLIGVAKALDLMVTGRAVSPGEAHALGILNRLFAAGDTAAETLAYAERLAGGATAAIGEIKRATYEGMELPIADALARERAGIEKLFATADAQEGLSAFAEKRRAEFKGA
ncbi:MAG TPA: enoyl-CoA hydratase-related protein [Solirubrobacter sp.]|nr:enoyl-CoA hydratase-related protein [Solirubrobacter sp.]